MPPLFRDLRLATGPAGGLRAVSGWLLHLRLATGPAGGLRPVSGSLLLLEDRDDLLQPPAYKLDLFVSGMPRGLVDVLERTLRERVDVLPDCPTARCNCCWGRPA